MGRGDIGGRTFILPAQKKNEFPIINKCTRWKLDKNRNYVYRRDGQHRLERNWALILYLLLDVHVHQVKFPELEKFIMKNARRPASAALQALKKKLWDIYKNFPPLHGRSIQEEGLPRPETGFRKLIVSDDGRLQIIWL